MIASVIIIAISAVLFVYWFRYACLMILSTNASGRYARDVAAANRLQFLDARETLSSKDEGPLDDLQRSLNRDYRLVTYLLQNAATFRGQPLSVEQWMLRLDYRMMTAWYKIVRFLSATLARRALIEMSSIVNHLANAIGERTAISPRLSRNRA